MSAYHTHEDMSKLNGRTPKETIGQGLKDCFLSGNTKTFWKKVSLLVGGASVVCVVSHRYQIFFDIMQEYCRRLLVLPYILSIRAHCISHRPT